MWAEAYALFLMGESLQLSKEAEELANVAREHHKESNAKEGLIRDYLDKPITVNWYSLDKSSRLNILSGDFDKGDQMVFRQKVCAVEVYEECLKGDLRFMKRTDAKEINQIISNIVGWVKDEKATRFGNYGPQKGFKRV